MPTDTARKMIGISIAKIAESEGIGDYLSSNNFPALIPHLTVKNFRRTPLNTWGTTAESALSKAYSTSPYQAVRDWAEHEHPELLTAITRIAFTESSTHARNESMAAAKRQRYTA